MNSKGIRIFLVTVVYFILLTAFVLPHHHHEEAACYTSTHCEDNEVADDHHADEPANHQHDNSPDEPKQCLSSTYYVYTDTGASIKRIFDIRLNDNLHHYLMLSCISCVKEEPIAEATFKLFQNLPIENSFTTFVSSDTPLRAPPSVNV